MTERSTATEPEAPFFEPLSHLDASFLALESPTTHMHVAAVVQFEAAGLKRDDGGIDIAKIKAHILGKLKYIPRYRQRLAFVPATRHPVWVDDDHFNFDYHVRHTSLPRPGHGRTAQAPGRADRLPATRSGQAALGALGRGGAWTTIASPSSPRSTIA